MQIVLDKSYWQEVQGNKLRDLCTRHEVIMTESLFYEILTSDNQNDRARCFKKLPETANPFVMVQLQSLLKYEITNSKPAPGIEIGVVNKEWFFNPDLRFTEFQPNRREQSDFEEWQMTISSDIEKFKERVANLSAWYPELQGFKPGSNKKLIDSLKECIATEPNEVKRFYNAIQEATNELPTANLVDEKWFIFRWLQIQLLAGLDYIFKYGDVITPFVSKNMKNDFLDLEYWLAGCMVGAIATTDKIMKARFKSIIPQGVVLS
ncbi:hypothetical protein ACFL6Q_02620 [Candidatus Neomarinimicrobiota bacterium]